MEKLRQIEGLIQQIETSADPGTTAAVRNLVGSLLEYHDAAIERLLEIVVESGEQGEALIQAFARDELLASLLLLYNQHPEDLPTRVRRAVDTLPNLQFTGISEIGVVRLRALSGNTGSRDAIEQVIYAAAPEAARIEIEGLEMPGFVPLEALLRATP